VERARKQHRPEACFTKRSSIIALGILLVCCPCASALNPSLDVNQYAHSAWTVREGFFKGIIFSIAQTPNGYLWLGTEFGLVRFDGVRTVPWQPPPGENLPDSSIQSLLAARDGRLWIGTREGLASLKDGKLTHYPELTGQNVGVLFEDSEGTVWAGGSGTPTGRLCAIQGGGVHCDGEEGGFGRAVTSLYEDTRGNVWAGAEIGLWRWKPRPPRLYPAPHPVQSLIEGENGAPLIATQSAIGQFVDGKAEVYQSSDVGRQFKPTRLLRDRNGSLWIGTQDRGLLHVHQGRADLFSQSDGLSGKFIQSLFEDREGNIWVATLGGLDRFRDFAVATISARQGLSSANVFSVLAARDGSIWFGTLDGLNRWKDGQVTIYRKRDGLPDDDVQSLFQDDLGRIWISTPHGDAWLENGRFVPISAAPLGGVQTIAEDSARNIWLSHITLGLSLLLGGRLVDPIPWARLGRKDFALTLVPDLLRGGLWLGFSQGGVAYFKDGELRASYGGAEGLGKGRVTSLQLDRDGTLWAATQGGLSRVKSGLVATLTSRNGLPCDTTHWVMEDDNQAFWLYMACGLVRIARPELDAWIADPKRTIQAKIFDSSDGVTSHAISSAETPRVAKSADGRIWFLAFEGVSVIDPRHIPMNKLPPPVHIEQITADRKTRWQNLSGAAASNLRLPALSRDLQIDYTALSLVAPEKIRFRIKLEGHDPDWKDAGNERKAFYNDLPPRQYRFRVIASNNSDVWNETGDTLEFSIDPAWYQTSWFYASCVAAFLAMLWGLYRLRLYQIRREFNAQLDGRVDERLRVARELHDTMLQSFQAALIQMQAARNIFTRRPEKTEESLDKAINTAAGAIAEGRSAIQDLRLHAAGGGDLVQLITTAGQELARSEEASGNPPVLGVTVEGARRDVAPLIQDEVYRIARELLRNAFHHAQAGRIEVEIRYDSRQFRLHVRDDGKGIDSEVLKAGGRAGHYGLPGMRERANRFGGKLDFWSEAGAGTEAVLTVPGAVAYGGSNGGRFAFLRRKLWIHER